MGLETTVEEDRSYEMINKLIEKGFTPHHKGPANGMIGAMGSWEEEWWDKPMAPQVSAWAIVAFIAVIALFLLILVKGWPFGG